MGRSYVKYMEHNTLSWSTVLLNRLAKIRCKQPEGNTYKQSKQTWTHKQQTQTLSDDVKSRKTSFLRSIIRGKLPLGSHQKSPKNLLVKENRFERVHLPDSHLTAAVAIKNITQREPQRCSPAFLPPRLSTGRTSRPGRFFA